MLAIDLIINSICIYQFIPQTLLKYELIPTFESSSLALSE